MEKGDAKKKISDMQLFPVAFNSSHNSTSWVSLKNESHASGSGYNIDYLVIQKLKSQSSLHRVTSYLTLHSLPWQAFTVATIFLNYVVISYSCFFIRPKSNLTWQFYVSIMCDVVFILDVIFAVFVYVKTSKCLPRFEKLRKSFLLVFDSLLSLPYSYIYLSVNNDMQSVIHLSLRCIAFLRLYRLCMLFWKCEKSVCQCRYFVFFVKYFCYVFVIQHGLACMWYLLAHPISSTKISNWTENVKTIYHPKTIAQWYFISNYAVISGLMKCGFGDILPSNSYEKVLSVVGMCFGILFSGLYISSLILLFLNSKCQKHKLEKQAETILKHLQTMKNMKDPTKEVLEFFRIFWSKQLGILTAKGLTLLPQEVNNKVNYNINNALLKCSVIFRNRPDEFLRKVSSLMKHEFYLAGENIYSEMEMKCKMVIVKSGTVDILSEEDHVTPIISFGPGTCLGEISLLLCLPVVITLRAATYVEVQVLYTKDFYSTFSNYPEVFSNIRIAVLKRIQKLSPSERKGSYALKKLKDMLSSRTSDTLISDYDSFQMISLYHYPDKVKNKRGTSLFERVKFPYIFNADTKQMLVWEFFIVACVLFLGVTFPYYMAYEHTFPMWFEIISDCIYIIFIIDVYVLVTTSISKRGYTLNTFNKILDARMDTVGFHLDVLAAVYIEAFSYLIEDMNRFYYLFKLNRLLKIYRVSILCSHLENVLMSNSVTIAFAKYVIYMLLLVYWFSALLYFQTCYYDSCLNSGWFITKIINDIQSRILTATVKGKVLLSFYFGLSCSLGIGVGDILSSNFQDLSFIVCGLLLGWLIFGYCISKLTYQLQMRLKSLYAFNEKVSMVKYYMKDRLLGNKLETRIVNYLNSQWHYDEAYEFLNEIALLYNVPKFLQHAILMQERFDALKKIRALSDLGDKFLNYLVLHTHIVVLPPNENFKNFGCINREMYVILRGHCLMQSESNEYKTLGPNKAIGFPSLLFGLPSLQNLFTLTDCILIHINITTFDRALISVSGLHKEVYQCRQLIIKKFQASFEVKIIENPQFGRKKIKLKQKKLNEKNQKSSFINTYKYCLYTGESYSHLSNRRSRIFFLKYLLMPICILPYGRFLKIWTTIRLIITLLVAFGVPMQYILSPYRPEVHYVLFVIDLFVYVDMYLKLHVAYYGEMNQLVLHPWKTAEHYLKGPFIIDFIIWFPLSACIQLLTGTHTEGHSYFAHTLNPHVFHCSVLLIRIFDAYRLPVAFNYMKHCSFLNIVKYILYILLCIHWWSTFIISRTCKYLHTTDLTSDLKSLEMIPITVSTYNLYCREHSWIAASEHRNYSNFIDVYVSAVYWMTSNMVGIGFGDIYPQNEEEIIVSMLVFLSGMLYFGYILANIVSHAIVNSQILYEYEEKLLRLIKYMRQERIDKNFQSRVREYVNYNWTRIRGFEIHILMAKVYNGLHEDILLHLYEDTLRHVPMFENVDQSFFRVLGKGLREQYFLQDQMVIKVNDIAEDIFIVHKGMVEILSPHNVIPITIGRGGVFGNIFVNEISLCSITVRALKDVDVLCLRVETFRQIIKDYPFIQKKIGMFSKHHVHKHFVIPNTYINEDVTYFSKKNNYWIDRHTLSISSKKSFIGSCRASFIQKSYISNIINCTVLFSAYCNCLLTTYQFCFQQFTSQLLIIAIFIDVIFLLKFILEINNPSYRTHVYAGFWERCLHRKWNRTLDFLANLPFSYSLLFLPFISSSRANFYFSIWRCTTLLRMYYIIHFLHIYKNRMMLNRFYLELSKLCVCFTLICHLCACLWYFLVCPFKKCNTLPWKTDVLSENPHELYLKSLYFIISVVTGTGPGDIVPKTKLQIVFVIAVMIGSKICFGYLITQFIAILRCGNLFLIKYETMVYEVKNYFLNIGVRRHQLNDAWNYLCSLWKRRQGFQIPELIVELPRTLRIEVLNSVYGGLLKESYIFSQTERDFIRQLTPLVKLQTYFPGNYIVRDGDVDTCMYFIHRGDVEILSVNQNLNETVHEILHATEVFGIVQGLFKEIPHHFSFRALTITDIVILKLNDWEYLLKFFPKSKEIIYQRVDEIYYTI